MAEFLGSPNETTWGIVLSKNNKTVLWPSENEVADEDMKLELSQATLGAGAVAGERNIVELSIVSEENSEETQTFPVVSLREGLSEHTLLNLTLTPPVSFRLVAGSGPISIMGVQHNVDDGQGSSGSEGGDIDDEYVSKMTGGRKRKFESPVVEAKKSKVEVGKDSPKETVVAKKGKIESSKKPELQQTKDQIMKMIGGEDSDGDDDSNEDLEEFSPSDSDLDDDDGKNGLDMGEDSDDLPSEDIVAKPSPKKEMKQKATKPKPAAKQVDTKPKGAKATKASPQAIEAVKAKIRANKSLPKTEDKFKNYLKSLKVTDGGQVSELWKFVQQIRKP